MLGGKIECQLHLAEAAVLGYFPSIQPTQLAAAGLLWGWKHR